MNRRIVKVEPYWYNEKDCLGAGSFGEVYKGHNDQDANMLLAIKRIKKEKLPQKIINQEIQILQELSAPDVQHVNFVTLLDCVQDESHVYLVMEYCNGGDLHDYLKAKRKLDEASIKLFLQQIASALKILHDHKVVHRDLKPANILLSHSGSRESSHITFKIGDFGMGRFLEDGVSAQTFVGTPVFMAPEIFVPNAKYDYKADLWSIGAIVYQCCTGTLHSAFQNEPIRFPANIDPYLKDLLTKLLCREPSKRISFNDFYNHRFIGMEQINKELKQHAERQQKQQIPIQIHIDRQPKQQIPIQIQIDREQKQQVVKQPMQQTDRQPIQQIQIQVVREDKQHIDRQPKQHIQTDRQPVQHMQIDREQKQHIDRQPKQQVDRQPKQQVDRQPKQQVDRQPKQQVDRQPMQPAPTRSTSRSSSKDDGSSGVLMWFRRVFSIKKKALRAEPPATPPTTSQQSKTMTVDHREVFGIAHLETRFYVLCRSPNSLVQYSDQSPYIRIKEIDISESVRLPQDLAACPVSNCLYVVDAEEGCLWKVELGYPTRTTRWIEGVSDPYTVSVDGRTGRVTTFGSRSRCVRVHGLKGEALVSVDLPPGEIEAPRHAVETASGNFYVVCCGEEEQEEEDTSRRQRGREGRGGGRGGGEGGRGEGERGRGGGRGGGQRGGGEEGERGGEGQGGGRGRGGQRGRGGGREGGRGGGQGGGQGEGKGGREGGQGGGRGGRGEGEGGEGRRGGGGVVCEVSVKGEIVNRYEALGRPVYLALDGDGVGVYVADIDGGRVQQLGVGLKLRRTIPTEDGDGDEGEGEGELERPFRLCCSSSKGQKRLLVEHRNNNLTIFNLS